MGLKTFRGSSPLINTLAGKRISMMRYNWKVLSCSEYPDHWPWTPLSSNILALASGHTVPRDQLMLEEYPTFSYLEHSPDLLYFLRLSLFWCCCDLLYRGKWGEVWRQICLLPNFLAAANPQKEAPPNWKRNIPTFGQVLFFLIILIHFSLGVCSSFDKTNCYLSNLRNEHPTKRGSTKLEEKQSHFWTSTIFSDHRD